MRVLSILLIFGLLLQPAFAQVCNMESSCMPAQADSAHLSHASHHHHHQDTNSVTLRPAPCTQKVQITSAALPSGHQLIAPELGKVEPFDVQPTPEPALTVSSIEPAFRAAPISVPLRN